MQIEHAKSKQSVSVVSYTGIHRVSLHHGVSSNTSLAASTVVEEVVHALLLRNIDRFVRAHLPHLYCLTSQSAASVFYDSFFFFLLQS